MRRAAGKREQEKKRELHWLSARIIQGTGAVSTALLFLALASQFRLFDFQTTAECIATSATSLFAEAVIAALFIDVVAKRRGAE
jgi:hypothetical protein